MKRIIALVLVLCTMTSLLALPVSAKKAPSTAVLAAAENVKNDDTKVEPIEIDPLYGRPTPWFGPSHLVIDIPDNAVLKAYSWYPLFITVAILSLCFFNFSTPIVKSVSNLPGFSKVADAVKSVQEKMGVDSAPFIDNLQGYETEVAQLWSQYKSKLRDSIDRLSMRYILGTIRQGDSAEIESMLRFIFNRFNEENQELISQLNRYGREIQVDFFNELKKRILNYDQYRGRTQSSEIIERLFGYIDNEFRAGFFTALIRNYLNNAKINEAYVRYVFNDKKDITLAENLIVENFTKFLFINKDLMGEFQQDSKRLIDIFLSQIKAEFASLGADVNSFSSVFEKSENAMLEGMKKVKEGFDPIKEEKERIEKLPVLISNYMNNNANFDRRYIEYIFNYEKDEYAVENLIVEHFYKFVSSNKQYLNEIQTYREQVISIFLSQLKDKFRSLGAMVGNYSDLFSLSSKNSVSDSLRDIIINFWEKEQREAKIAQLWNQYKSALYGFLNYGRISQLASNFRYGDISGAEKACLSLYDDFCKDNKELISQLNQYGKDIRDDFFNTLYDKLDDCSYGSYRVNLNDVFERILGYKR